jgi:hypothetical protein
MTGIEKKIRLVTIQEAIEHEDSKIAAIQTEDIHGADRYRLERVSWYLQRAVQLLNTTSFTDRPADLLSLLEVSVDGIRGRRRCELVGAENNNAG